MASWSPTRRSQRRIAMEEGKGFKWHVPRLFHAALSLCHDRRISEGIEKTVIHPRNKANLYPAMIFSPLVVPCRYRATCPPSSPVATVNPFYRECGGASSKRRSSSSLGKSSSSSRDSASFGNSCWFSEEEEEEAPPLIPPKSKKNQSYRKERCASSKHSQLGDCSRKDAAMDSIAVVKSSSNPYNDFRASMVEMIVEKHIFSAKDLEQLLLCFLSLNSCHHHRIIVEAFKDILNVFYPH